MKSMYAFFGFFCVAAGLYLIHPGLFLAALGFLGIAVAIAEDA